MLEDNELKKHLTLLNLLYVVGYGL